jgi:hypothetical protein
MRKSLLIICGLVLAVCFWLLLRKPLSQLEVKQAEIEQTATNQTVVLKGPQAGQASAERNPIKSQSQRDGKDFFRALGIDTNSRTPIAEQMLQKPIDFYGKVIDENSNAVSGASIAFRWDDLTAPDWTRTSSTLSDADGLFSLNGKRGATLTVSASKEGYYTSRSDTDSFYFVFAPNNQVYSPDQSNPIIFHLHKKGQGADLVTSANGLQTSLAALVPLNGAPLSVDLLQQKVGGSGDLELSQVKPDRSHWQSATNWSFHMNIPTGGFIEQADAFPFIAPEGGYQTTVDLNFVKGEPDWKTQITKTYYIAFGQPRKYGWFRVEANIAQQTVFLTYAINPSGSRNLEPAN